MTASGSGILNPEIPYRAQCLMRHSGLAMGARCFCSNLNAS